MLDIFDLLFFSGADVNNPCHRYQRAPIMYAAVWGDTKCDTKLQASSNN